MNCLAYCKAFDEQVPRFSGDEEGGWDVDDDLELPPDLDVPGPGAGECYLLPY